MSEENIEQTADLTRIESLLVDLNKGLVAQQEANADADNVEIIAKGADAIIAQSKDAVDTLSKSVEVIMEKLDRIEALASKFSEIEAKLDKGLKDLGDVPQAPKAVVSTEPELSPADQVTASAVEALAPITKGVVMTKCLAELKADGCSPTRKAELIKGISQLDSNFNPAGVSADLHL
jgi:hypothetical protein